MPGPGKRFTLGQARLPGSGRKKGTPNKDRAMLVDIATKELGAAPMVELCRRYKDVKDDPELRNAADRLLIEICSYCHPKPKAIEHSGEIDGPGPVFIAKIELDDRVKQLKGES
jgi:hypothetical protein